MPKNKITLYATNPVKVGGKRIHEDTFEVDTQEQADALIACGAATDPKAAAEKEAAEKEAAEKEAAEKEAAEKTGKGGK